MRKPMFESKPLRYMLLAGVIAIPLCLSGADAPRFTIDRPIDIRHIKLDIAVDIPKKRVDAVTTITIAPYVRSSSILLDGVGLDVRGVKVGANAARFSNTGREIEVYFEPPLPAGHESTITLDYVVSDPKDGLHFFAPSPDDPDAPYQVWSQGQASENRFWIPSYDDPNERQTTELIATVAAPNLAISNGTLKDTQTLADGRIRYHWVQDEAHPVYLVTLIVGEFAVLSETWRGKPVLYYAPPARRGDIERSFSLTPKMLDFFSDKIGVEYPWPKYAQTCCYQFGGGMENTSATTLGEGALHDERAALDGISDGLIAHELAHQWFGDLLTCKEWAHTWLNEGFATYFEALWDEHHNGADEFAYNMYGKSRSAISGGKTLPIVHRLYKHPDEQFDSRAYPKGAWVIHMLRRRLGDDLYWKGINHYTKAFTLKSVETSDLRQAFEQISHRSLERFFFDWTERPGHPVLDVDFNWDESARLAEIGIRQTQESEAFHFPLVLEFKTAAGSAPITLQRDITDKQSKICVSLPSRPVSFVVDPADSVLKEITEDKPRDLWLAQLAHDNVVSRIRAAQALAKDKTDANRAALAAAIRAEKFWGVQVEIAALLGDMTGEESRDALIATANSDNARVRRACFEALGKFKDDTRAAETLQKVVQSGDPSYRAEAAAIEAFSKVRPAEATAALLDALKRDSAREVIRSAALSALGNVSDPAARQLLTTWAAKGKPRECRSAAIGSLADHVLKPDADEAANAATIRLLIEFLGDGDRRIRDAAARALGNLGALASAAAPQLRELAAAGDRTARSARSALEKIEKNDPANKQIADLRKQLDALREANRKLQDEVETIEARMKADRAQ